MNKRWELLLPVIVALQFAFYATSRSFAAPAQDTAEAQAETRMAQIEEQQREKARNLRPSRTGKVEHLLDKYIGENPMNKFMGGIPGLHLRLGAMPSGAGFGLGPEYFRPDLAEGKVSFRTTAIGTKKLWYMIDTELRLSHFARRYLDLGLHGRRLDATSMEYYGPGPNSHKSGRTSYRREENLFDVSLDFKPTRRFLNIGFAAGYQWLNIGPGKNHNYISSEKQYPPSIAPGIDTQTNYLSTGLFLDVDLRDKPNDPHGGTHILVKLNRFSDRKRDQYSFRRIYASVEQYIPFFNKKRVVALLARSVLSYPDRDHAVPFYMQPTLGGTSDLRGYRRYRFYDNNTLLLNAEYRWEVFTLMDAAIFADAGKVFHRDGDFDLNNLQSDAGFGFRFKTRRAVVFRMDTAFSHEGFGLWLTFDHVF